MDRLSRYTAYIAFAASSVFTSTAHGQSIHSPVEDHSRDWRLSLTIFRSPGSGVQLSRGALALFVAHYPTIFDRGDGAPANRRPTTHFLRVGVARYWRTEEATSPYVSLSVAPSLTRSWSTSGILDIGVRRRLYERVSGQLGAAVLTTPSRRTTRLNPTIGLGVAF